uniref:Uncharacterized protein n=1 Tax=Arundo donax TaxID=35708 RepID=A0A0A9GNQ4_ARUDO
MRLNLCRLTWMNLHTVVLLQGLYLVLR